MIMAVPPDDGTGSRRAFSNNLIFKRFLLAAAQSKHHMQIAHRASPCDVQQHNDSRFQSSRCFPL